MHPSERNRLAKLQNVLLLAASDMAQAAAAARALEVEEEYQLARALETAIAVCYMRPFTQSSLTTLPAEFEPTAPAEAEIHAELHRLRDQVYAHTDKAGGRSSSMDISSVADETVGFAWREQWVPLDRRRSPGSWRSSTASAS